MKIVEYQTRERVRKKLLDQFVKFWTVQENKNRITGITLCVLALLTFEIFFSDPPKKNKYFTVVE